MKSESVTPPTTNSLAWRVMYTSTGERDQPIVVTGLIIAPTGDAPGEGRPVVAWAHPTTGIRDECSPSRQPNPFSSIMGLNEFLDAGWIVTATDYQGLGTDGPHPYLDGVSEAHAVIDITRAAVTLQDAHASKKWAVFGHSQGGQAALFAGQLATTYGPDLELRAVVAAAPSGDLITQINEKWTTEAYGFIDSYLVTSWQETFHFDPTPVLSPHGASGVATIAAECVLGGSKAADQRLTEIFDTDPAVGNPAVTNAITTTAPWRTQLIKNSPAGTIPVPTLLTQGTADSVISPSSTAALDAQYRANGTVVTLQLLAGVPHTLAGYDSVPFVDPFFKNNFS